MMKAVTLAAVRPIRDLGPRGSRRELAPDDPAGEVGAATRALLAAVPAWWAARARETGLAGPWLDVFYAVDAPAPSFVEASIDPAGPTDELTGEALGQVYVKTLSAGVRARHGRHYTPDNLAKHLWELARADAGMPPTGARLTFLVRDRACGAGALLIPPLREHVQASVRTEPALALAALPEIIAGIELDPNAAWLANVILAAEALPLVRAVSARQRKPLPALVTCGDGLETGDRKARIELQNPPYGRVKLSPSERERWAHVVYGHANLYGLFMAAAVEDLEEDGVLAALVPTSFTSGKYFENLRGFLAKAARLRNAAFVADRETFESVLQETCLVTFGRRKTKYTRLIAVNGHVEPVARVKVPTTSLPWLLPRRADDAPVAAAAAAHPLRLSDVGYRCSTGPLVWNRRADDLSAKWTAKSARVIWAADIDGGVLHRDKARDKMRYLRLREGDLDRFMIRTEPAILLQRTSAPEQARRFVAAVLGESELEEWGGRVAVENHVNVLHAVKPEPMLDIETLAAVLHTETMDRVIRSLSGSVAVSAYEIDAIPFPSADVLSSWNGLRGMELEKAVADAYRPGA